MINKETTSNIIDNRRYFVRQKKRERRKGLREKPLDFSRQQFKCVHNQFRFTNVVKTYDHHNDHCGHGQDSGIYCFSYCHYILVKYKSCHTTVFNNDNDNRASDDVGDHDDDNGDDRIESVRI
uniref:Uncharacterized protein n=1 Tax=Glossina pallidipes TaxID=7398 RepID=A0A1A9Z531_GLOPL